MTNPQISIIISTYNSIDWLTRVMWGYNQQSFKDFEMVIADDGSREDTKLAIEKLQQEVGYPIQHIWHEDNGFQKSQILNKAIVACKAPYIIMSDGDCIPRHDFVAVHQQHKEEGCFLSGGYFMLPMETSTAIHKEEIANGLCFDINWLKQHGLKTVSYTHLTLPTTSRV